MAISFYLPKDIDNVVKKVVEQGNMVSPNYISTNITAPNILKRNLVKITTNPLIDFNVIPLKLPVSHSTGNILKARSFDYDFVVSNDVETTSQPVFITDVGDCSFRVRFKEKLITDILEDGSIIETRYIFNIIEHNVEDISKSISRDTVFRFTDLEEISKKVLGQGIGEKELQVIQAFDLPTDSFYPYIDFEDNTFSIITEESVSVEEDLLYKKINYCLSNGTNSSYSNLRFAGALTYNESLQSFYPNSNVVNDVPNTRDFLTSAGVQPFLGFLTVLDPNQALLFNLEVGTTVADEYTITTLPNIFETSKLKVYQDVDDLLSEKAVFISSSKGLTQLSIYDTEIDFDTMPVEVVSISNPKTLFDKLKQYGILARIATTDNVVTKLFLNRLEDTTSTKLLYFRVEAEAELSVIANPSLYDINFMDIPGDNNRYDTASYGYFDTAPSGFNVDFSLSKPKVSTSISNDNSYFAITENKAVQFSYANADSFRYTDYILEGHTVTFKATSTQSLDRYGYENLLNTITEDMRSKLAINTVVDIDKGVVYVDTKGSSFDNLYISLQYANTVIEPIPYVGDSYGSSYNLITDLDKAIQNKSEAVLRLNKNSTKLLPTIENNCSSIILDASKASAFNLQPYAYNVMGRKVDEQTAYKVSSEFNGLDNLNTLWSGLSPFFVSITPLYTELLEDTGKILLEIDSATVDQKEMKNILIWTDNLKSGLKEGYGTTYKIPTSILNNVVSYSTVTPIQNSSLEFDGPYLSMNSKYGVKNRFGTSFRFELEKTNSSFSIDVTDIAGNVETCSFSLTTASTNDDVIQQSTLTKVILTEDNNGAIEISTLENRVKVVVNKGTSSFTSISGKLVYQEESNLHFMLNKE